ncbi:putative disease resistance RPP13-like protein 2 [Mangifera indica]|uniref:putative disease resistance RPP13-like protein 2 n=1 Tax=Mangifera indica TaxID=29780 RepID=UPI001CFC398A|nr:putative disease resistance RPP13-like protein 2 [Mangifera indica]
MTNLQTLNRVADDTWTKTNHESLVNLRELHLFLYRESERMFTFVSIAKLKSIQILSVDLSDNNFFPALQPLSHCPHLRDLSLSGKIKNLPEDMHVLLPNVESLSLRKSKLVDDPMPVLGKMLNLTILELRYDCLRGKKMMCRANTFPRVETLDIETHYLEEWQVEEGARPVLTGLELINYSQQFQLPERLKSVARLH